MYNFTKKIVAELSKNIFVQGVGNITITRRRNCRRLLIKINSTREVKVSIPFRASFDEAERFVFDKVDWIKKASQKIKDEHGIKNIISENSQFCTRSRKLYIQRVAAAKYGLRLSEKYIEISVPVNFNLTDSRVQACIKKLIEHAIKLEAAEYLPLRVKQLAELHNFKFAGVRVKNARTRWGSCSYRNNINLNINLVCLPDELSDYIILHELAHTVHKNHGPHFWELLDKISGNAKEKANQLKGFRLSNIL